MTTPDISNLSAAQLKALKDSIDQQIVEREAAELSALRADVLQLCAARGYTLQQVLDSVRKPGGKPAFHFIRGQIYSNPDDPTQTWRGFGGRPLWLRDFLEKGGAPKTLLKTSTQEAEPEKLKPSKKKPGK